MKREKNYFRFLLLILFSTTLVVGYGEQEPCDEYMSENRGIISSPNYPFNYSSGRSCLQRIFFEGFTSQNPKKICFTFYLFSVAKSSGCFNDYLEFPGFEGSSGPVRYCGDGDASKDYANGTRTNVFSRDFCWSLESGRPFDLRFRSMATSTNQGYFAEYEVRDASPDNPFSPDNCSKPSPTCPPKPCAKTKFRCHNGACIPQNLVCDGVDDCSDSSDEGYWHARCPVNASIEACSFEDDLCQFDGQGIVRNKSSPGGPRFDHTFLTLTTGNFVYFDGSLQMYMNYLATPVVGNQDHCLSFWFYMSGYVGSLSLYILDARGRRALVWFRTDDHGMKWHRAEIDLPAESFPLQEVVFKAADGSMDVNNIAIDDISFLKGQCYQSDISCTFELGSCGWKPVVSSLSNVPWSRAYDDSLSTENLLMTMNQSSIYKMLMNSSSCQNGQKARIISRPVVDNVYSSFCLRFSFLIPEKSSGSLAVYLVNNFGSGTTIWNSGNTVVSREWKEGSVSIASNVGPFQIAFEGVCKTDECTEVAIDNIELTAGYCSVYHLQKTSPPRFFSTVHPSGCDYDQYKCTFSEECISRQRICDGRLDCTDKTDETECMFAGGSDNRIPYDDQQHFANEVIIGVSVVCVAIFLTVVAVIVIAARRRSILLRIARVRMMRRCTDSVLNDNLDPFPAFMEPKPPPYDFSPPTAPFYALNPPPYGTQYSDGDQVDANAPPSYETARFVEEQSEGGVENGGLPERQVFNVDDGRSDELSPRGMRTTSI